MGLANAWGKPVIVFVNSESNEKLHYTSFGHNLIIQYNRKEQNFQFFDRLLGRFRYSLLDTTLSNFHNVEELLIVQSEDKGNPEIALDFIAEITKTIKDITNEDEIELVDLQKGSSKGIFDIDFKALAELAEKIIFFIPTLRDKKAETNKKVIESKKLQAEIEKIKAETNKINSETEINEAKAVIEIIEKYQELGVRKLQLGEKLIITADEKNNYFLAIPEKLGGKLENENTIENE